MSQLNDSVDILRATTQLQLPKDAAGQYETIKNKQWNFIQILTIV